jgi:hypothetical protein
MLKLPAKMTYKTPNTTTFQKLLPSVGLQASYVVGKIRILDNSISHADYKDQNS